MALVKCPDCEKMVSDRVDACPFCGCPAKFFTTGDKKVEVNKEREIPKAENSSSIRQAEQKKNKFVEEIHLSSIDTPYHILAKERDEKSNSNVFKFGNETIIFSNSVMYYRKVYFSMKKMIENEKDDFSKFVESALDSTKTTEQFLNAVIRYGQDGIDACLDQVVANLIKNQILTWNREAIKSKYPKKFVLKNTSIYCEIMSQYNKIDEYAEQLATQREIERSSRSQWQGGGFGIRGAIKGAVKAGAMNMVTNSVRGIGDSVTDSADARKIEQARQDFLSEDVIMMLVIGYESCLESTIDFLAEQLAVNNGISSSVITKRLQEEVSNSLSNLRNLSTVQKYRALKELIEKYPYNDEVIEYLLSASESVGVSREEAREIALYINRAAFDEYEIDEQGLDCTNSIEKYKDELLQKDIIDEDGCLTNIGIRRLHKIQLKYFEKLIRFEWMSEADITEENIKNINSLPADKCIDVYNTFIKIAGEHGVLYSSSKFEVMKEYKTTPVNAVQELVYSVGKQYEEARTVDGITFTTLKEAIQYRKELEKFEDIYSKESYANYDSKELENVINQLSSCEFKNHLIQEKVEKLRSLKEALKIHEKDISYQNGRRLIEKLKDGADGDFFVYGGENFLRDANLAVHEKLISSTEALPIPIAIYNKNHTTGGIKGFVITDSYFYNFNTFLGLGIGNQPVRLDEIEYVDSNGNTVLFHMNNGKCIKVKMIDKESVVINAINEVFANGKNNIAREEKQPSGEKKDETKIFCPYCGKIILRTAKFCNFCGKENTYGRNVKNEM